MVVKLRQLISRLNRKFISSACALRRNLQVPVHITVEAEQLKGLLGKREILSTGGETKDLSETGIAFFVDSIRLREHYLVGEGKILNARLSLPNGTVRMKIIGQRYEQIDMHASNAKYLIGAVISEMAENDRKLYEEFLRLGNRLKKENAPLFKPATNKG